MGWGGGAMRHAERIGCWMLGVGCWMFCLLFQLMPGDDLFPDDPSIYELRTRAPGPAGALPLTEELLRTAPSGDLFGLTQNVGMGGERERANARQFLILSTAGGLRSPDGKPIALGFHTGHWEISLQVEAAARELRTLGAVPFAAAVS